ncbi:hypothetical protein A3E49_01190 [Candidatus Saccharibacteria bacterium RIFCSPHIGHO2_12_FULL_49_19]|nr:MAG: hypothetical protein A2708_00010 [Candidatus Saccharibacteria bacterium RIFCSPHIGHO2_01_FULL_49_21]OGL36539.1 MAG: hypothetical protein A3E49_01190 [Candidatus Saccharibacteria bacterium RIFCSPHIGHO2_12_FULL_49_19]OGL38343.1 MAG: hypothetical protein A3B63_03585 [Candidatus Saccharibacteria bacterium RIFCSPLOWO2_01_FULL_49_22]HLG91230.1 glycosyltransferase family 2 protein [Candidatus Saccharimonadales bacterium]
MSTSTKKDLSAANRRTPVKALENRGSLKVKSRTSKNVPYTRRPASYVHKRINKRKLALLLPAHNEELIIATTIKSASVAGQKKGDIYVVDDGSTDKTRAIAVKLLGRDHVLTVKKGGKALAVAKAIKKFDIEDNYEWLHVADADSVFSLNYFKIYRDKLNSKKYAVAVGFVQSMRGNWISTYRALTYTYSQHVNRRIQSYLGMISVFPGPITAFRTDIIKHLDFDTHSFTEDFDITLQVHRKKLGKIRFIPRAVNYTQDPQTLRDFIKQNLRWQRGFFQGVKKYRIGFRPQAIDVSLGVQLLQPAFYLLQMFILMPLVLLATGNWLVLPAVFAADFIVVSAIALVSSVAAKRWMLLGSMPYFYFLRWIEIGVFVTAFFEVIILGRFSSEMTGWDTSSRRYELSNQALKDTAATG